MNIESEQYCKDTIKNTGNVSITAVIDGETMYVPINPDNRHYQAILVWEEEAAYEIQAAE